MKKSRPHILNLVLTYHWFDETAAGNKPVEYRKKTARWMRLIYDRRAVLTHVRYQRAYTRGAAQLTLPINKIDLGPCPLSGWDDCEYIRIHSSPPLATDTNRHNLDHITR